jgi:ribosomal protein L24
MQLGDLVRIKQGSNNGMLAVIIESGVFVLKVFVDGVTLQYYRRDLEVLNG